MPYYWILVGLLLTIVAVFDRRFMEQMVAFTVLSYIASSLALMFTLPVVLLSLLIILGLSLFICERFCPPQGAFLLIAIIFTLTVLGIPFMRILNKMLFFLLKAMIFPAIYLILTKK